MLRPPNGSYGWFMLPNEDEQYGVSVTVGSLFHSIRSRDVVLQPFREKDDEFTKEAKSGVIVKKEEKRAQ
jgi:hypothetical protein